MLVGGLGAGCSTTVDTFFKRYVRKECLTGDSATAQSLMRSYLCSFNMSGVWSTVEAFFDLECLGVRIYEAPNFQTDTSFVSYLVKNRAVRLVRTEAYLYGSSRLGLDVQAQLLADSLDYGRYLYNPLAHVWHKVGNLDTTKRKFGEINDSIIRYNQVGWKRYEFGNHLGNVLAVISDRKLLKDTLEGYFLADLYAVQDYDPFGMVQPGRSWKRKENYRFGFSGKEKESWGSLDFDARMYSDLLDRWLSIDPLAHHFIDQSPYSAFNNNPLIFIDPTGMGGDYYFKKDQEGKSVLNNYVDKGDNTPNRWFVHDPNATAKTENRHEMHGQYWEIKPISTKGDFYNSDDFEDKGFLDGTSQVEMDKREYIYNGGDYTDKNWTERLHEVNKEDGTWVEAAAIIVSPRGAKMPKGGRFTEPKLPQGTVVNKSGVKVEHYYRSGDHGPPHLHVKGQGKEVRIGQNGKPIKGDPELSPQQQAVVKEHKREIRKAIKQIGKYHKHQQRNAGGN